MAHELQLIPTAYLEAFLAQCPPLDLGTLQTRQSKQGFSSEDFEYYIVASSLFSSKIEGNSLDFNSFFFNKGKKDSPKSKEVTEIEDLVTAYRFASENALKETNFLQAHLLLSGTLLKIKERGKYRTDQVGIRDSATGRLAYLAVEPEFVQQEMRKLFHDIDSLIEAELSLEETCYYASMIHLVTAMIHPFGDGNGRAARLLEKWFISTKLGKITWAIPSEKYYWDHRPQYYQNIALGFNYYALHWERCLPFLAMLPKSIQNLSV